MFWDLPVSRPEHMACKMGGINLQHPNHVIVCQGNKAKAQMHNFRDANKNWENLPVWLGYVTKLVGGWRNEKIV